MLELFSYAFLQRALLAGIIVGIIAPLLGSFLMVRRYSLIADTLAHASLAGVAIGAVLGVQPVIAAACVAALVALGIEWLRSSGRLPGDALLATFLTGSLALAVVIMSATGTYNAGLLAYLFGSITTVGVAELQMIAVIGALVVLTITLCYRRLFLLAFDEEVAQAMGLNVRLLNLGLAALTAVTVAVAMRVVGVLLIGALMVVPVLTALQFARGFRGTMLIAVVCSVIAVVSGLWFSLLFDLATGGTIVLTSVFMFMVSLALRR
ncbi:MAG: metal ABC transporter permease, partial [Candidatus Uhrbacteria bacterium]|nr:metal ABC transporter permease [Candidatus Uhrbacteria bacterium]